MSEHSIGHREVSTVVLHVDSVREPGPRAPAGHAHRIPKIRGRAQEFDAMSTWRRWQDWVVVGLGVLRRAIASRLTSL
jgi:hypothetical protein